MFIYEIKSVLLANIIIKPFGIIFIFKQVPYNKSFVYRYFYRDIFGFINIFFYKRLQFKRLND